MDSSLNDAFRQLDFPAGGPDPQARRAALISFVRGGLLNINEIRLLKELLSTVELKKDVLPNLPVELVLLIAEFLDERDISSCLAVSSGWNRTFMGDRVVFSLADRLFPQLTWKNTQSENQDENSRTTLRLQFLKALRDRVHLMERAVAEAPRQFDKNYLWDAETDFKLCGQDYAEYPQPNLPINQKALYAYGRVAWQRETHTLVIDNLHDRSRKILSFPGGRLLGPEMKLTALGDRLVVATMDRHLLAWEIETGKFERKTLPSIGARCNTFGKRVTTITDKEIYHWSFGGPLLAMSLPDLDLPFMGANQFPKAFVHPHLENVVFARQVYRSSSLTLRFMVHKFSNRKHINTFSHDAKMSWLSNEILTSSMAGFIPLTHDLDQKRQQYYIYEFDMYHEKFSRRYLPAGGRPYPDTFMLTIDDDFVVALGERNYWVC